FRSLNTRCFECHRLPTFEAPLAMGIGVPSDDPGIGGANGRPGMAGLFAVPTLRNVAETAPYMHDGSIATLEEVLDTYAAGGRHLEEGPNAGDGRRNPFKSGFVPGFPISEQEKKDILAFLHALTDESFLPDPRFSDPFPTQSSALDCSDGEGGSPC
ncbi:MAG: hypothetical protein MI919_36785, partial [Holophagales bacterium]|nr:hypothetical protein [Holophagales bacterium]